MGEAGCCFEGRAGARRRHLLGIARTLFVERGFHATGIAQIAAASGIKVGQIYRDFRSKEDIIAAIVEMDVAAWLEEDALAAAVERRDVQALRAWIGRLICEDDPDDECRMMTEILAETGRNARIAEINRSVDLRVRRNLEEALEALVPTPDRREERMRLVSLILVLGTGFMIRRMVNPAIEVEDTARHFSALVERELAALGAGYAEAA